MLLKILFHHNGLRAAATLALLCIVPFVAAAQPAKRVGGMRPPMPKYKDPLPPVVVPGLTKEVPVTTTNMQYELVHDMDADGLERAKKALTANGKFTDARFAEMAARANIRNFPPRVNTVRKITDASGLYGFTGYVQGTFLLPHHDIAEHTSLVWVPQEDNPDLPAELKDGKDLFFFWTRLVYNNRRPVVTMPRAFVAALKVKLGNAQRDTIRGNILDGLGGSGGMDLYQPLVAAGYTEEEAGRIMQLSDEPYLPAGFMRHKPDTLKDEISKLISYRVLDYQGPLGTTRLYWIPTAENGRAPAMFRPQTEEGAFISALLSRRASEIELYSIRQYFNKPEGEAKKTLWEEYAQGGYNEDKKTQAAKQQARTSSGTTAAGVQYSTADMSAFGPGLLGCMAIYPSNGASAMYVVSIYGASLGDKAAVADAAYKVTGLADSHHTYKWFPGVNSATLEQRYRSSMAVRVVGKYTIQ